MNRESHNRFSDPPEFKLVISHWFVASSLTPLTSSRKEVVLFPSILVVFEYDSGEAHSRIIRTEILREPNVSLSC